MGCASSKKRPVCRNCSGPITRSYSMHVHHPPQSDGDSYHVVALKSTTLGYLQLDQSSSDEVGRLKNSGVVQIRPELVRQNESEKEFALGVIDAKTWSKMIEEKIPKFVPRTPITTPPGEPETINAWELMEGLDDTSPLRPKSAANHIRSFSFHVNPNSFSSSLDEPTTTELQEKERPREISGEPQSVHTADNNSDSYSNSIFNSNETSVASDFDTEVITAFRKSLELLPPASPFHLKPLTDEKEPSSDGYGDDDSLDITNSKKSLQNGIFSDAKNNSPPRVKEKLVLYFTSLRGVRKTYEDCCHVRHILKATGVRVDERDVSMHSGFKEELKELLGGFIGGLPKVFIGKRCIGGAAEIRRFHEDGQLETALEGCEMVDDGSFVGGIGGGGVGCEACGDIRFVPCETCSGSCKIYYEDESEISDDEEKEEGAYGFQRCPDCNENGLTRCPICCD